MDNTDTVETQIALMIQKELDRVTEENLEAFQLDADILAWLKEDYDTTDCD